MDHFFENILREDFICGYVFPLCSSVFEAVDLHADITDILNGLPVENQGSLDGIYKKIDERKDQAHTYRILQITDVHLDLNYQQGAVRRDCGDTLCCSLANPITTDPELAARRFGELDGQCDIPVETFNL